MKDLLSKKVAVLGLGIEGIALVDFLIGNVKSLTVLDQYSTDELKKRNEGNKDVARILDDDQIVKKLGSTYLENLEDFDIIFRSPGVNFKLTELNEAQNHGVEISTQIKLFFELCPCMIIGVTGTKGKGTTSSLITEILKSHFEAQSSKLEAQGLSPAVYLAGNIGYPAISFLSELRKEDVVVLELSSFQLADLNKSPDIAVVTNLTIDHLDYHKDQEEYHNAKFNILKYQTKDSFAILNAESTFGTENLSQIKSTKLYFSGTGARSDSNAIIEDKDGVGVVVLDPHNRRIEVCRQGQIKLLGRHNLENIAAAALVADVLNIETEIVKKAVKNFMGLPHRLEFVRELNGAKFINDSFATNPGPTIAAIKSFSQDKILILGGSTKGADFTELAEVISASNVKAVIVIGDESEKILKAIEKAKYQGMVYEAGYSLTDAVRLTKVESSPGDIVLFSPACASFDMFKNYKDRGEKFRKEVNLLKADE